MTQRTSIAEVEAVLATHYDGTTDLQAYIDGATALVDLLSAADTGSQLSAAVLTLIETYVAADLYCISSPLAMSEKIGQSSETYAGRTTFWDAAVRFDITGWLVRRKNSPAKAHWLGTRRSNETAYVDRD